METPFQQLLRQRGQKATPARVAVLQLLARRQKPLGVGEVMNRLAEEQFDQATIYRTLNRLEEIGFVRRVDFQEGRAYYELAEREEHHHAVCVECGKVEDIHDCCAESMDQIALRQSGFAAITQHSLEFFGLCRVCADKLT